jgi:PIN domain nuclease of toxin-antitoxin system
MNYLLDTHAFLWFINGSPELPLAVQEQIEDVDNQIWVSVVSFWEIAIKYALGKLLLDIPLEELEQQLADNGFHTLSLEIRDTLSVATLPLHHGDPFDRLLICQAVNNNFTMLTRDQTYSQYQVLTFWRL